MDKDAIETIASDIADDMGYDYFDLSPKMRMRIYNMALGQYEDMLADKADMMRKNEADGGIMRAKYARGSEEDIPEQEDMPMEEFEDIKKMLGVPGSRLQASRVLIKNGISSRSNGRKKSSDGSHCKRRVW